MTDRRRNLFIILLVLGLLAASGFVIASQPTRLGLDLKGGVELVYQGEPTPQVPKVTSTAIENSIDTIRKRIDVLGVAEPEVQKAGADQISIGLPAVKNAARAEKQVGTTAQLHMYDWEPNVIGDPNNPIKGLFTAVKAASKAKPKAEPDDIPAGGPDEKKLRKAGVNPNDKAAVQRYYDRQNDTSGDKYYLFGPNKRPVKIPGGDVIPAGSTCSDLLTDYEDAKKAALAKGQKAGRRAPPKGSACADELAALGTLGPPPGSTVIKVPLGIVVIQDDAPGANGKAPTDAYFVLEDDSELSGADITDPKQAFDQQTQEPIVTFGFTDKGRAAFERATKREAQRGAEIVLPPGTPKSAAFQRFGIVLDEKLKSNPTIDFTENPEGIPGDTGAQINIGTGPNATAEAQDLAKTLQIGALPIKLKLISKTQVSATLGKQALNQGLLAGGVGLLLTLIFLIALYRVLGLIAAITLLTYAVLLFALVKLIPITLTLPGIAGLILTLGVAADANIVIFERIKEEVRLGRSIPAAISGGYRKALRTIIDANVVTIGVAFILFILATAGVKGFAFTLGVGTIVSLFTAVLATSAVLGSLSRTKLLGSKAALGAQSDHHIWRRFDFMGASRWFFSMSGVILVIGALAIAALGINFGIDFESGTRITAPLEKPATVDSVRAALPAKYRDAKIQQVSSKDLGKNVFQISTRTIAPDRVNAVVQTPLDRKFGVQAANFNASSIGPTFGAQIARTAVIAIVASLLLISIYIGFRFEFKFAVPVLIALAHDLLITAGVYALTDREVTTSTVAALLTILGYSLYDTIIVFDRIRENAPRMPRATFSQIVNRSMSEVLARSLVTSFSTLLPIMALLLFGGETLKDFAFALLVGVASGTYSSIFIASPVLTLWKEREPMYRRRRKLVMEEHGGLVPAYATAAPGDEEGLAEDAEAARKPRPRTRRQRRRRTPTGAAPQVPPQAPMHPPAPEPRAAEPEPPPELEPEPDAPPVAPLAGGGLPGQPPPGEPLPGQGLPGQPAKATDGADGKDGADGADGKDGADGAPAKDGADGAPAKKSSPVTSTAGAGAPRQKPKPKPKAKTRRQRKKHGRR